MPMLDEAEPLCAVYPLIVPGIRTCDVRGCLSWVVGASTLLLDDVEESKVLDDGDVLLAVPVLEARVAELPVPDYVDSGCAWL